MATTELSPRDRIVRRAASTSPGSRPRNGSWSGCRRANVRLGEPEAHRRPAVLHGMGEHLGRSTRNSSSGRSWKHELSPGPRRAGSERAEGRSSARYARRGRDRRGRTPKCTSCPGIHIGAKKPRPSMWSRWRCVRKMWIGRGNVGERRPEPKDARARVEDHGRLVGQLERDAGRVPAVHDASRVPVKRASPGSPRRSPSSLRSPRRPGRHPRGRPRARAAAPR